MPGFATLFTRTSIVPFFSRSTTSRLTQRSLSLLQAALWSLMFWSYAPLFTVVVTAAIFAVKIPIEVFTSLSLN